MNQLSRIIEPPTTKKQELGLQQYKRYMGHGIIPFLSCIETIPSSIVDTQGQGLQVIDLGGGKGSFCKLIKDKLPKAKISCIDTSITGISNKIGGIQMIGDDLFNVQKYIDNTMSYTLLICVDTIHHLDNPTAFFNLIKSLPFQIGLYIKDYIRPTNNEQLETKMHMLSTCIYLMCKKDIKTAEQVITLSKQSLLAALTMNEVITHTNGISGVICKETNSSITYELTRKISE